MYSWAASVFILRLPRPEGERRIDVFATSIEIFILCVLYIVLYTLLYGWCVTSGLAVRRYDDVHAVNQA